MHQFSQQHRLAHNGIAKRAFVQFRYFIHINLLARQAMKVFGNTENVQRAKAIFTRKQQIDVR